MSDSKKTLFTTTVSTDSDRGPVFRGYSVIDLFEKGYRMEDLAFLILVGRLPSWEEARIAKAIMMMVVDNGPCVSGALNSIVAARAAVPISSALCAGLVTIGPRFGGASTAAAELFDKAVNQGIAPQDYSQFVLAETGDKRIPGFGHPKFNLDNPDQRVRFLSKLAHELLGKTAVISFAMQVEEILTTKKSNLILNIDGMIGATLLDIGVPEHVIDAFFIWPRALGFLGHICDQHGEKLLRLDPDMVNFQLEEVRESPER